MLGGFMRVFLCWSGPLSFNIAKLLHDWLGDVIQAVKPFMSSEDIRQGQRWQGEIGAKLAETSYGILCLTKTNLTSEWIHFEAGAISKNISDSHVTAVLAGVKFSDLLPPLSQFQHTEINREQFEKLVKELNALVKEESRLEPDRLKRMFDSKWPELEANLKAALAEGEKGAPVEERGNASMLEEILALVRELKRGQDRDSVQEGLRTMTLTTSKDLAEYTKAMDLLSRLSEGAPIIEETFGKQRALAKALARASLNVIDVSKKRDGKKTDEEK
jgi:hypothetical protein